MELFSAPVRLVRDLPIGFKLAMTVIGVLVVLGGLSWFASDRLAFVTSMQRAVAVQAILERQVQHGLTAAQELRVVARELQLQQTLAGIRSGMERATKQTETVTTLLRELDVGQDQKLRDDALDRLGELMGAVKHAGTLRSDLITARQKRLLQARPTFENAMKTLMDDLARGGTADTGVASVRGSGQVAEADQHDPAIEAANRYRLAMIRLQASVMLFLATGNGSASNDIRDAVAEANAAIAVILSAPLADGVKADARMVETIGKALATAASDLVAMSRQLDQVAGADVEAASLAMSKAFETLAETVADRGRSASDTALAAGAKASKDILMLVGGIAVVMALTGAFVTRIVAGPILRLTRIVQAIAGGKTDEAVPYTTWKDEIGRMAASVETLRGVMRQAFIQSQMIEQLPVGVMTAEPAGEFRITYVNAEARQILRQVGDAIPVSVDNLVGKSIDVFHPNARHQRDLIANPANLPHAMRMTLGEETLDLRISPMFDRDGVYAGPLVIWRQVTAQVRLVRQFEENVGAIASIVANSADSMCQAASAMRDSAVAAGESTLAVSVASDQASVSVNTAASAAEEMSMSVTEIRHQVAESAKMANTAVAEAQATDASVGSLSQAAERISAVVSLISDIAGRTNLLALNATIEAARAGDAGKGFAIVAGEVKSLATQTAKATHEISDQIAAMQAATGLAVTALRSISGTIQRMNEIAGVISGSVEQQALATHSIAEAVQHASAGTAEVNSNIAAVARVVDETGGRAGGVLQAATEVTGQAATLKDEVAKFLVAVQQAA